MTAPRAASVTLVRDEIKLEDQEAKAKLIEMPDGHGGTNRIGVIDLPSFYATIRLSGNDHTTPKFTSSDVAKLIKKLKAGKSRRHHPGFAEQSRRLAGGSRSNSPASSSRTARSCWRALPTARSTWTPTPIPPCFTTARSP